MIQAAAYGRLGDEPRSFDTKTGTKMVTAALAVNVDDPENSAPIWFRIITFGRVAEELLRHGKGDLVSVCGRVRRNSWKDRDGKPNSNPMQSAHAAPRCHATSKRSGCRCKAPAVRGFNVCRMHGARGGAPSGTANGRFAHGLRTQEAIRERRNLSELIAEVRASLSVFNDGA